MDRSLEAVGVNTVLRVPRPGALETLGIRKSGWRRRIARARHGVGVCAVEISQLILSGIAGHTVGGDRALSVERCGGVVNLETHANDAGHASSNVLGRTAGERGKRRGSGIGERGKEVVSCLGGDEGERANGGRLGDGLGGHIGPCCALIEHTVQTGVAQRCVENVRIPVAGDSGGSLELSLILVAGNNCVGGVRVGVTSDGMGEIVEGVQGGDEPVFAVLGDCAFVNEGLEVVSSRRSGT